MGPNVSWSRVSSRVTLHRRMPPSRKVLQAVLFTSLLWLSIDIVLLTTYTLTSESSQDFNSVKLPSANKRSRSNHDRIVGNRPGFTGDNIGINVWNKMLGRLPDPKRTKISVAKPEPKQLGDSVSSDSQTNQREHSGGRTKHLKGPLLDKLEGNNDDTVLQKRNLAERTHDDVEMHQSEVSRNKTAKKSKENASYHYVKDLDVTTSPRNPNAPGERGKAVRANPQDKALVELGWRHASFNEFVSDMISVERSVKDTRPFQCKSKMYADSLPKTTVIICFTEESWSTLLRTVHSVLNRSPPELIEEVLLMDDFSQREYLKEPLDKYMSRFPKVRIIRLQQREGLIRARIRGADEAKGEVLTFLDSHIECNVGWLEPLLQRIWDDRKNVVCPEIDGINADSLAYDGAASGIVGAFSWDMQFKWQSQPLEERQKRRADQPLRTPAMAGGLFAIEKAYFYELGTYDPGFDIWGAENLELSFKVWMCGGRLEILPCSRVGHIFRKTQPYKFPEGNVKTFLRNTQRMVEVWIDDDYKDIFYKLRPELVGKPFGDIQDRILLKKQLGCHNFKWYLDNVFPSLQVPDTKFQASGEIRNQQLNKCVDTMGRMSSTSVFPCHGKGFNQHFSMTWNGVIQFEMIKCISSFGGSNRLSVNPSNRGSCLKFQHTKNGAMLEKKSNKCLDVDDSTHLRLRHCDGSKRQQWKWAVYYNRDGSQQT